jgi:hypothetical protein
MNRHFSQQDGRKLSYPFGVSGNYASPRTKPSSMVYVAAGKNLLGISPGMRKIACLYDLVLDIEEISFDKNSSEVMVCTGIGAIWLDYESGNIKSSNLKYDIENLIISKDIEN